MKQSFFYTIAVLLLAACQSKQNNSGNSKEAAATTELPSLSYTIYTEKSELFAEFRSMVVGDTTKLAGHFTLLGELFTAITDGTITLSLVVDDNTVSQESTVSSSPGIFRYAILPAKAGLGKLVFDIKNKDYTDQIVIDNVTVFNDEKAALASKEEQPKGNQISYLKEQAWKVEFANMAVTRQAFNEIIKTTGEILPAQGDEMVIAANSNGVVTFAGNKAVVGTSVRTGEMLFSISGKNLTDGNTETRFTQAKVAYEKAKADYDRAQELAKDNIVSQKEFLETKARYETEQANYNNLSRNYQSGGQKVISPISGFVKNVLVAEGQYVSVGQPIASVSQNRSLVLKAEVSQKYFSKLPFIASANFKTVYDNKTYSIESLNGRLLSYGKSNDANTLFIPVTFSFDNKGEVVPGSLVDVYLKLQPFDGAIVIPVSALIEEQGIFYAYVQTAGESFVKRELTLGGSDGINIQVLAGLKDGERVVTKGAYQIKLATASGTIPAHGHAH
ncbi:MAG: efflux RND transporter periplasmic adaptor subunit [Bacteroidota bacterium]|nr:efflux RND transporter periplasmic adaptor subunit [Bacteroidota bacterium]